MDPVNPSRLKQRNEKYQKGIRLLLCLHKGEAGSGKEIQKQKQKQKKKEHVWLWCTCSDCGCAAVYIRLVWRLWDEEGGLLLQHAPSVTVQ